MRMPGPTACGRFRRFSRSYPDVKNSGVDLEASDGGFDLVNSEGTEVRAPESVTFLRARALAQAPDGMSLRDAVTFHALDAAHLPAKPKCAAASPQMAENVVALAKAPKGEDYSGPVLFEGAGGRADFRRSAGQNLALTRRPVGDGGRGGGAHEQRAGRAHGRARAARTFDVVDDPTQKEWRGRPLFGSYEVDREGVPPKPLRLVEKGVLKDYLLTRQPVRGFEGSNGRARLPGSFGASSADHQQPVRQHPARRCRLPELKKKLIELCRTRNKPYGIIVRKMDFPSHGQCRRSAPHDQRPAGRHGRSACRFWSTKFSRTGTKNWCAACASAASMRVR